MTKYLFTILFFLLCVSKNYASDTSTIVYADVNGLVCDFCARAIEKVFKKQDAVNDIDVNLDEKRVTIHLNKGKMLDEKTIIKLINDSGYDVRGLRYE